MKKRFSWLYRPVVVASDRIAPILKFACWTVLATLALSALTTAMVMDRIQVLCLIYLPIAMMALVTLYLIRRGHIGFASGFWISATWFIITANALILGGTISPSYIAYAPVVVVASFFLSRAGTISFAAFTIATGLAIALADSAGLLPTPVIEVGVWRLFATMAGAVAVTTVAIEAALGVVRDDLVEAENQTAKQAILAAFSERSLMSRDLDALLGDATLVVRDTLEVDLCKALELDRINNSLLLRAGVGWDEGLVGKASVENDLNSQAGYTYQTQQSVAVEDFSTELRFRPPALLRQHAVVSGISCCIRGPRGTWGVLGAHCRQPRVFSADEIYFLESVANVLFAALERRLLEERVRDGEKLEAVAQLAGGVAHDFNNLLMVINSYAESLLASEVEQETISRAAYEIRSAVERAAVLTRGMVTFARHDDGANHATDVNELLRSVESMLRSIAGEDVELTVSLGEDLGLVGAAPSEVEQILVNLVVNARHAMPNGGSLRIETQERPQLDCTSPLPDSSDSNFRAQRWLRLSAQDTGIGMAADVRARIFEPFFTTKDPGRGTGLGLASVHGIVSRLGGEIRVESSPGLGALFEIDLPNVERKVGSTVAIGQPRDRSKANETILVVEDDDAVRTLICEALEREGYSVIESNDGARAMEIFNEVADSVDAVISDVVMPRMGGIELSHRLRLVCPDLCVILVSGYADRVVTNGQVAPAGVHRLDKPFSTSKLLEVLGYALGEPRESDGGA